MRAIGKLASSSQTTSRPVIFLCIHDAATLAVVDILTENLLLEEYSGVVSFNGTAIEVKQLLTSITYSSTIPENMGSGLIRRNANFVILTDKLDGTPFLNSVITRAIWFTGTPVSSVVFSIWGLDVGNGSNDLNEGTCFGYYNIDSDTGWNEGTGECRFSLIDITVSNEDIVAASSDSGVRGLLSYNSGYAPKVIPTVYGAVQRVKTLRGYPDKNDSTGSSTDVYFSGTVPEDYSSVSTDIVLEINSYDSSMLRQLIASGNTTVRIRMGTNEVISGTLAYNAGTNKVTLSSATRNTFYYSGIGRTPTLGGALVHPALPVGYEPGRSEVYPVPSGWTVSNKVPADLNTYLGHYTALFSVSTAFGHIYFPDRITAFNGILENEQQTAISGVGFAKINTAYVNSSNTVTYVAGYAKMTQSGINGIRTLVIDKVGNYYGVKSNISGVPDSALSKMFPFASYKLASSWRNRPYFTINASHPAIISDDYIANAYLEIDIGSVWAGAVYTAEDIYRYQIILSNQTGAKETPGDTIELYYRDPLLAAVGGTANVTTYSVIYHTGAVTFNHYLNNGFCAITSSQLYCEGDNGLIPIPSEFIVSKEDAATEYGYTTLLRIKLTKPPMLMKIGARSNEVYVDTTCSSTDYRRIVFELLSTSTLLSKFMSNSNLSPTTYSSVLSLPLIGFICSGESFSEMLDKLCFQLSSALRWNNAGSFDLYDTIGTALSGSTWAGNIIDANTLLENTASVYLGKTKTTALDSLRDKISIYLNVTYGSWMDPFYVNIDNKEGIGKDEAYIEYAYDCMQTRASAQWAIDRLRLIGAAGMLYSIKKTIGIVGSVQGLIAYEPLDAALVNYYPGLTDAASLSSIMTRSGATIIYTAGAANFLLQGVVVIETVECNLTLNEISVVLKGRLAQNIVDFRGAKLSDPPSKLGTVKAQESVEAVAPYSAPPTSQDYSKAIEDANDRVDKLEQPAVILTVSGTGYTIGTVYTWNGTSWVLAEPANSADNIFGVVVAVYDTYMLLCVWGETYIDPIEVAYVINTVYWLGASGTLTTTKPASNGKAILRHYGSGIVSVGSGGGVSSVTAADMYLPGYTVPGRAVSGTGVGSNITAASNDTVLARVSDALIFSAITTAMLGNSIVTTAKIEDLAITTAKIATGAVTTFTIANLAVTTTELANSAVTAAKLASDAVTTAKILDSNVTTAKLAAGAITDVKVTDVAWSKITGAPATYSPTAHNQAWSTITSTPTTVAGYGIADALTTSYALTNDLGGTLASPTIGNDKVTTAKILDANVTAAKLATNAVTTAKIADGSVTTAKIVDGSVTTAKIMDGAVGTAKLAAPASPVMGHTLSYDTSGTPAWKVADAGVALSVFGNSTSARAYPAAIAAAADGTILGRAASALSFLFDVTLGNASNAGKITIRSTSIADAVVIDTALVTVSGRKLSVREVDVCDAGVAKKMLILASAPY